MNKVLYSLLYLAALTCVIGCAKTETIGPNEDEKRYLEAWMQINHPEVSPSGLGIYILEDNPGNGAEVTDDGWALVDYKISSLEGNISSYSDAETARQLGTYDKTTYYGPKFWATIPTTIQAGVADALVGVKVGTHRKIIVPSWLMTYREYDDAGDYFDPPKSKNDNETATSYSTTVYEFTVRDFTEDLPKWEVDSIGRFFANDKVMVCGKPARETFITESGNIMTAADSISYGFYYKQIQAPVDTTSFAKDTTLYINYTGKLLNGLVFDTTIEDVAKDNNLYSSSKTYEPMQINWGETYSEITMGSSKNSTISGFAKTLWQMRSKEKGVGVFYSPIGYGYDGSGSSIPACSPLIFEIEFVDKPEE